MMMSLAEEESQDPDWVQKLRSQGGVPMQSPDDCGGTGTGSGWASPPGYNFMVRGPTYFSTKSKIPAAPSLLKPLAFDWIKSSSKIHEILRNPSGRVNAALASRPDPKGGAFVWAFNLQVPSKENYSAIAYFVSMDPIPEGSLMAQFIDGDDAFRAARLKLIANIVHGPWIVRTAVGEQAICILGRAVSCRFHRGPNFMEVDVDIGASMLANAVVHLALGYVTSITVDLAFLIEAQSEEELPEKLLGTVRFANLDPASALSIDHANQLKEDGLKGEGEGEEEEEEEEEEEDDEKGSDSGYESFEDTIVEPAPPVASSMTTRLWRSLSTYINGEEDSSKNAGPRREQSSSSLFSDAEEEN